MRKAYTTFAEMETFLAAFSSFSIVSAYETGERTPSAEMLPALFYLYKCSTDYLLGKNNDAPCYYLDAYGLTDAQIKALENLINTMKAE